MNSWEFFYIWNFNTISVDFFETRSCLMVGIHKPMIINLREHLHTAAEATATNSTRHAGTETVSAPMHTPSAWSTTHQRHLTMKTQEDEELKDDFKWLIDFDLRSVFLQDIDGDDMIGSGLQKSYVQGSSLKQKGKMRKMSRVLSKHGKVTRYVPYTYSELITHCLSELGDVSVREIYSWISERFPSLRPSDITWKNAIRHTLTVNPLFLKRKEDCGKCHTWCLNKSVHNENLSSIPQISNSEIEAHSTNTADRSGSVKQEQNQMQVIWPQTIILQTEINNDVASAENVSNKCNSKTWFVETTAAESDGTDALKTESDEYYELEIPITSEFITESTSYTEPIEVRYLIDETAASIPVHIF